MRCDGPDTSLLFLSELRKLQSVATLARNGLCSNRRIICEYNPVQFRCEGLSEQGVVLIPPESPHYDSLLAEIERRSGQRTDGEPPIPYGFRSRISEEDRATSAILVNIGKKPIAAMHAVWRYETVTGGSFRHSRGMLSAQSLLLPFGRRSDDPWRKIAGYWHTILPGSKRYLSKSGLVGDNTDVRPPTDDEKWRGGIAMAGARARESSFEGVKEITLILDGVFFLDGEFVGPNHEKLFERTVADAEAHMIVAKVASDAQDRGLSATEILGEVEKVTGPAPEHPGSVFRLLRNPDADIEDFRRAALEEIAFQLERHRQFPQAFRDHEDAVSMIIGWNRTAIPDFRRA